MVDVSTNIDDVSTIVNIAYHEQSHTGGVEDELVEMLVGLTVSCRLWPDQVEGPYFRDVRLDRRNIVEDRIGLPLRVGLRLLDAGTGQPIAGAVVEVWHADHEGCYSGFAPFRARPGGVVTSESVSREVVAPSETFLRGRQPTDERGMCAFDTIYPGWYSSRTVHIHAMVLLGDRRVVTQLYFPDELTGQVFAQPPYAGREPRDTINATDSIYIERGERAMLDVVGDVANGLSGVICLAIDVESLRRPDGLPR